MQNSNTPWAKYVKPQHHFKCKIRKILSIILCILHIVFCVFRSGDDQNSKDLSLFSGNRNETCHRKYFEVQRVGIEKQEATSYFLHVSWKSYLTPLPPVINHEQSIKNATWCWREQTCQWHDLLISLYLELQLSIAIMILDLQQVDLSSLNCGPVTFCLGWIAVQWLFVQSEFWSSHRQTDGQTDIALHMSTTWISTGVLKNHTSCQGSTIWQGFRRDRYIPDCCTCGSPPGVNDGWHTELHC